jgi:hypothetical protein
LGPINSEFFTSPTHFAWIKDLARASQRNFRLPAFSMDCHHDGTFVPLMLMPIEPAPLLD